MAKFTLEIQEDYDFSLLSIFSHVKDYRLSWEINQSLHFDLQKDENLSLNLKGNEQEHSLFSYYDEENQIDYFLIGNRSESGWLIPEEKCDYFLLIKGHIKDNEFKALGQELNQLKHVLATTVVNVEELKSKENLIF